MTKTENTLKSSSTDPLDVLDALAVEGSALADEPADPDAAGPPAFDAAGSLEGPTELGLTETHELESCATPSAADGGSNVGFDDALSAVLSRVDALEAVFRKEFDRKLAWDATKQQQIDRLHGELEQYRAGAAERGVIAVLHGVLKLRRDLVRHIARLRNSEPDTVTIHRLFDSLEGFAEDVDILLGMHGVLAFECAGDTFDAAKQRAVGFEPAESEESVGRVFERLEPGFERGAELMVKERVRVLSAPTSTNVNEGAQNG